MSNFIIEEERGTYTGRRHPNNGYYAFTGPTTSASSPRHRTPTGWSNYSGPLPAISELPHPS